MLYLNEEVQEDELFPYLDAADEAADYDREMRDFEEYGC